jgi:hypothetical protein
MDKITKEVVVKLIDRHGYFSIGMKKGYHAAMLRIKHPDRKVLELVSELKLGGNGFIRTQKWGSGEISWLTFEGRQAGAVAWKVRGEGVFEYAGDRMAAIIEYCKHISELGSGKTRRFHAPLSGEEVAWREEFRKRVAKMAEPPQEVRDDFSWMDKVKATAL